MRNDSLPHGRVSDCNQGTRGVGISSGRLVRIRGLVDTFGFSGWVILWRPLMGNDSLPDSRESCYVWVYWNFLGYVTYTASNAWLGLVIGFWLCIRCQYMKNTGWLLMGRVGEQGTYTGCVYV